MEQRELQLLREHHDAERFVLSLRELREYERVQLGTGQVSRRLGDPNRPSHSANWPY